MRRFHRHPTADSKDFDRDDERPEIKLLAVAERMVGVGRLAALPAAKQQKRAVAGVDQRMDAFGDHRRAAGKRRRDEFARRDGDIRRDCGVDRRARFRFHDRSRSSHPCRPLDADRRHRELDYRLQPQRNNQDNTEFACGVSPMSVNGMPFYVIGGFPNKKGNNRPTRRKLPPLRKRYSYNGCIASRDPQFPNKTEERFFSDIGKRVLMTGSSSPAIIRTSATSTCSYGTGTDSTSSTRTSATRESTSKACASPRRRSPSGGSIRPFCTRIVFRWKIFPPPSPRSNSARRAF